MNTNLTYKGTLFLSTKTRNSVTRNHGTQHLFRLLSKLLCKEDFNTLSLPTYFMLYKETQENLIAHPNVNDHSSRALLHSFIEIVRQSNVNSSGEYESTFTSSLDSSNLISSSGLDTSPCICLVSGDRMSILAVVSFDLDTYNTVANGGQSLIKWVLTIGNN